jgi:hypothetical protein
MFVHILQHSIARVIKLIYIDVSAKPVDVPHIVGSHRFHFQKLKPHNSRYIRNKWTVRTIGRIFSCY